MQNIEQPHFVADYRKMATDLIQAHGFQKAMDLGVGGGFEVIGKIEIALLTHLGFGPKNFLIDVGCGSGRLAAQVGKIPGVFYHGTDVVPEFLEHARELTPRSFKFTLVDNLKIPDLDSSADFVTFFSVVTHLLHLESYAYMMEAKRVLKPGGKMVVSFLEMLNPVHRPVFNYSLEHTINQNKEPHNAFIEEPVIRLWSDWLDMPIIGMFKAGTASIPLTEPVRWEGGEWIEKFADLGQSVAVFQKR